MGVEVVRTLARRFLPPMGAAILLGTSLVLSGCASYAAMTTSLKFPIG